MNLQVIIPVKPLALGKSRLANVLNEEKRFALNMNSLCHTLDQVGLALGIESVLVVSRDEKAIGLATSYGAKTLVEAGEGGLNSALDQATQLAITQKASGVLILPVDLPFLCARDICDLVGRSSGANQMVIVPDRWEEGTNAMLLFPPGMVEYCYGKNSYQLHIAQAESAGLDTIILRNDRLEFDVDLPEDLKLMDQEINNDFDKMP